MSREVWDHLLYEVRQLHLKDAALQRFCPFPDDITAQAVTPFHIPPCDLMLAESGFLDLEVPVRDAFIAAAPFAHWRETYKDTSI